MQDVALEVAKAQGLWAVMFVILLFWVLKENGKRESKYQDIIDKLTQKFEYLEKGIDNLNNKLERWVK